MNNIPNILASIFFIMIIVDAELTEIVETDKGKVCGEVLKTVQLKYSYSVFKGIPYAKPPVGYGRRFRKPQENDPWQGVLSVTKDPNRCAQIDPGTGRYIGDEDCLYLNVYTPELNFTDPESRVVMVWIHGGAFMFGSADTSTYGPDFFIEENVVIVAMNYRLGPFGFLSFLPEYFDGNNGLRDQNAALKWVQRNIRQFGGDPDKVTIFGESAGAASVDFHRLSSQSKGLFRASIAMSGTALHSWAFMDKSHADMFGWSYVNYALGFWWSTYENLYAQMVTMSPQTILSRIIPVMIYYFDLPFRPTIEVKNSREPFLTDDPREIYRSRKFNDLPHILGFTSDEAVTLLSLFEPLVRLLGPQLTSRITKSTTSTLFIEGVDRTQKFLTTYGSSPVYYYRNSFDYDEALHKIMSRSQIPGSGHADDIAHIFWINKKNQSLDANSDIGRHRKKMVKLWTNFAKYLTPTSPEDKKYGIEINWPESGADGRYLEIDRILSVGGKRPIDEVVQQLERREHDFD